MRHTCIEQPYPTSSGRQSLGVHNASCINETKCDISTEKCYCR
jgi:hypothetical protein